MTPLDPFLPSFQGKITLWDHSLDLMITTLKLDKIRLATYIISLNELTLNFRILDKEDNQNHRLSAINLLVIRVPKH